MLAKRIIPCLDVKDGRVVSRRQFGRTFLMPFGGGLMAMVLVPQVVSMLCPLILAIIISALMRRYRICSYRMGEASVPMASLTRRAFAQLVDGMIVGAPSAAGIVLLVSSFPFFGHGVFDPAEQMFIPVLGAVALMVVGCGCGTALPRSAATLFPLTLVPRAEGSVWAIATPRWSTTSWRTTRPPLAVECSAGRPRPSCYTPPSPATATTTVAESMSPALAASSRSTPSWSDTRWAST